MATVTIHVDESKVDMLLQAFQMAVGPASLMQFLETDVVSYWEADIMNRFLNRGDRKERWDPLKESTQAIRWAEGFSANDTNVRTGDMERWLFASLKDDIHIDGISASMSFPGNPPDAILEEKFRTAQEGKDTNILGYGPTVARPIISADETDLMAMLELLSMHIVMHVEGLLV